MCFVLDKTQNERVAPPSKNISVDSVFSKLSISASELLNMPTKILRGGWPPYPFASGATMFEMDAPPRPHIGLSKCI